MKDPFVDEIRQYRACHAKRFNFDIHAICSDLRKYHNELRNSSEIDGSRRFVSRTNASLQTKEIKQSAD